MGTNRTKENGRSIHNQDEAVRRIRNALRPQDPRHYHCRPAGARGKADRSIQGLSERSLSEKLEFEGCWHQYETTARSKRRRNLVRRSLVRGNEIGLVLAASRCSHAVHKERDDLQFLRSPASDQPRQE